MSNVPAEKELLIDHQVARHLVKMTPHDDEQEDGAPLEFFHDLDALLLSIELPYEDVDESAAEPTLLACVAPHVGEEDARQRQVRASAGTTFQQREHVRSSHAMPFNDQGDDHSERAVPQPSTSFESPVDEEVRTLGEEKTLESMQQKKKKKSSSQRQKEELTYLRTKVTQLERELDDIRCASRSSASPQEEEDESAASRQRGGLSVYEKKGGSMWETLAQRQLEEKRRAELENAQLKQQMEGQIKLAKSLERMLRKRSIWDDLQDNKRHRYIQVTGKKSAIFETLAKSVDAKFAYFDHVLESHGLTSENTETSKADVAFSEKRGVSINFVDVSITPFDFRATANAIWKHMGMHEFDIPKNCTMTSEVIEQTDDTLAMTRIMSSDPPSDCRSSTMHTMCKRMVQDSQVLTIWETVTESNAAPLSGQPKIELVQTGWLRTSHILASDGSTACMIQSYVCMAPAITETHQLDANRCELLLQQRHDAGAFTEVIISSYQQNVALVRQSIENELMDKVRKYFPSPASMTDNKHDSAPLEFFRDLDALLLDLEQPCEDVLESLPSSTPHTTIKTSPSVEVGAADVAFELPHTTIDTQLEPLWHLCVSAPSRTQQVVECKATGALALCDGDTGGVASLGVPAAPSSSSAVSATALEGPRKTQKPSTKKEKTTSRQRQKEELAYLHTKVLQLEQELSDLKRANRSDARHGRSTRSTTSPASSRDCDASSDSDTHLSVWENLAQNQLKDKIRAKLENAQLKEMVEEQIKFARSLERMLRKRPVWDDVQENKRPRVINIAAKESDIFDALSKSIDLRFASMDQELEAHGPTDKSTQMSDASVAYSDAEGLHVNFIEFSTVPFEFRKVADLSWKYFSPKDVKIQNLSLSTEIIEKTEDTLVSRGLVATQHYEARSTTMHSVHKRAIEANQVLFVWESVMRSRGFPWSGNAGIQVVQKGWMKMSRVADDDGSFATRVHSYIRTTPALTGRHSSCDQGQLAQFHDAGVLTETIISAHQENARVARQSIENELMDAYLKKKAGNRRAAFNNALAAAPE